MLLLLAWAAIWQLRWSRSWPFLLVASISTAALFLSLSSPPLSPPSSIAIVAGFLNVPHLVLVWLFALSVFQLDFTLKPWHILVGLAYSAPIGWFRAFQFEWIERPPFFLSIGVAIGSIVLVAYLVWQILREWPGDLLEPRRQSRLTFVVVFVLVTVATGLVDLYLIAEMPVWSGLIKSVMIWPAILAGFVWLYGAPESALPSRNPKAIRAPSTMNLPAKDADLLSKLTELMEEERAYLEPSVTVSQLAERLGVTSHRLRALINSVLGHENFNQFLNRYRIRAIRSRLDDPSEDHVPILTIALEGGFSSISPFNRAFKHFTGDTPKAYRSKARKEGGATD